MKLTEEQSRELFRRTGNYLKEACDRCGKPLAEVRWTRRGEPGEWCSQLCRDGVEVETKRRGGRPPKYRSNREQRKAHASQQRNYRERLAGVTKTTPQLTGAKGLADAILASQPLPLTEAV